MVNNFDRIDKVLSEELGITSREFILVWKGDVSAEVPWIASSSFIPSKTKQILKDLVRKMERN
jgi:hypothetical protein